MKTMKIIALVLAIALIIGLSTLLVSNATGWNPYRALGVQIRQDMMGQNSNNFGGMMSSTMMGNGGGMNNMMQGMMNSNGSGIQTMMNQVTAPTSTINNQTFSSTYGTPPTGVTVNRKTNTISIDTSGVTLPIEAAPIWYPQFRDFWLVYGLVNPRIVVTQGETIHFLFINMDNQTHVPAVTTIAPPYQYMPMMQDSGMQNMMSSMMGGGSSTGVNQGATASSDWLAIGPMLSGVANPSSTVYSDITLPATFNSTGTFWYLCLYPGHAQMGMYGEITVIAASQ